MEWLQLLIRGLATWRVAHMLVNEEGPKRIFRKLREASGIEYVGDFTDYISRSDWTPLHCVYCTSIYVGFFILWLPRWMCAGLALSAIAIGLDELHGYIKSKNSTLT